MSEYTSYDVVHVEDLQLVCSELTNNGITSVLLADPKHPLYSVDLPMEKWNALSFEEKWLILMTTDDVRNRFTCLPLSVSLTIDENPDRWELRLDKNGETRRYLFSDTAWGDMEPAKEQNDSAIAQNANIISAGDICFMEEFFQFKQTKFADYLKMGPGNAWNFIRALRLPEIEMLCDWHFYYPDEGLNRCILWQEYDAIVNSYDQPGNEIPLDDSEVIDGLTWPA